MLECICVRVGFAISLLVVGATGLGSGSLQGGGQGQGRAEVGLMSNQCRHRLHRGRTIMTEFLLMVRSKHTKLAVSAVLSHRAWSLLCVSLTSM